MLASAMSIGYVRGDTPVTKPDPNVPQTTAARGPALVDPHISHLLGPEDQVTVKVLHVPEISPEPMRIDAQGDLTIPLVGTVHVAGLSEGQAQQLIAKRLSEFVKDPEVTVNVATSRSRPVFVLGSVAKPGEYQLRGKQTLAGLLSECEGIRNDAGYRVLVTRHFEEGPLPFPNATVDESTHVSRVTLPLKDVTDGGTAAANLSLRPDDVVSIPRGEMVYVVGDVKKAGGIVLEEREKISVLQALSLAEGTLPSASTQHAKILHQEPGSAPRSEREIDLKSVLEGRNDDLSLSANDILFVPTNKAKAAWVRGAEAAIQLTTGFVIYRR